MSSWSSLRPRIARAVFGRYAPAEKARLLGCVAASIFGVDWATKLIALSTLEEGEPVSALGGALRFQLAFNPSAMGPFLRQRGRAPGLLGELVCLTILGVVALRHASAEWSPWRKLLLFFGIGIVSAVAADPLGVPLYAALGPAVVPPLRVGAAVLFGWLLLRLARSRISFALVAALEAANAANLVGFLVHPRGVIDFLRVSYFGRAGIANVADLCIGITLALACVFVLLRLLVSGLRRLGAGARLSRLAWIDRPLGPPEPPASGTSR